MIAPCLSLNAFPTERAILAYSVGMAKITFFVINRADSTRFLDENGAPAEASARKWRSN